MFGDRLLPVRSLGRRGFVAVPGQGRARRLRINCDHVAGTVKVQRIQLDRFGQVIEGFPDTPREIDQSIPCDLTAQHRLRIADVPMGEQSAMHLALADRRRGQCDIGGSEQVDRIATGVAVVEEEYAAFNACPAGFADEFQSGGVKVSSFAADECTIRSWWPGMVISPNAGRGFPPRGCSCGAAAPREPRERRERRVPIGIPGIQPPAESRHPRARRGESWHSGVPRACRPRR